jgi:hypothetical protein
MAGRQPVNSGIATAISAKSTQDRTEEGFVQDLFDKQKAYLAAGVAKTCEWRVESNRLGRSTDPLAAAEMQHESQIETQRGGTYKMKSIDKEVELSAQTTRTKFDGALLPIRSRKSFFEVPTNS